MSPPGCLGSLALSTKDLNKSKAEGGKKASSPLQGRRNRGDLWPGEGAGEQGVGGQEVRGPYFGRD